MMANIYIYIIYMVNIPYMDPMVKYIDPKNLFVCPKNPALPRSIPILFGWDWNHQSYSIGWSSHGIDESTDTQGSSGIFRDPQ